MCLEIVPEGQLLHDPAPDAVLYLPAGHAVHVAPSGPVYPGLHRQVTLPDGASELGGHDGD